MAEGDTTPSIEILSAGETDVAITASDGWSRSRQ